MKTRKRILTLIILLSMIFVIGGCAETNESSPKWQIQSSESQSEGGAEEESNGGISDGDSENNDENQEDGGKWSPVVPFD